MHFSNIVTPLLFAAGALAQYGYSAPSASSGSVSAAAVTTSDALVTVPTAPAGQVAVQVVKVSDSSGALKFIPDNIKAPKGSMIQFQFWPKSTFAQPCVPQQQANATAGQGFFSGFMPVQPNAQTRPTFTIMVNTDAPIWFYCSQAKHCQSGMVGVINAPGGAKTIDTFRAAAANAPENISPGGVAGTNSVSSAGFSTTLLTATGSGTVSVAATSTGPAQVTSNGSPAVLDLPQSMLGMVFAAFGAAIFF